MRIAISLADGHITTKPSLGSFYERSIAKAIP